MTPATPSASTNASATSTTTRPSRRRLNVNEPVERPPDVFVMSCASVRAAMTAGARPKSTATTTQTRQEEREGGPVERDLVRARDPGGADPDEQIERPARHDDARHAAREREQQALDEELADEASGARAERGARDHLVRARGGPREEQVRDVGAGRGEHQSDRAEQQPERLVNLAEHVVGERHQLHAERPVGPRSGHIQPLLDGIELSVRSANRHPGFQAAGHVSESPAVKRSSGIHMSVRNSGCDPAKVAEAP